MTSSTCELVAAVPQVGRLDGILLRRAKHGEVVRVDRAEVLDGLGLQGDHRSTRRQPDPSSKRHISLIQAEHLQALRGHGGITARVVTAGSLSVGDPVGVDI
jgi:MOSC domain-containing protein YiiM